MPATPAKKTKPGLLLEEIVRQSSELKDLGRSAMLGKLIHKYRDEVISKKLTHSKKDGRLPRSLSEATDEAVKGLYLAGAAIYPEEAAHLCVLAIGGYGRARLAPFSDIDLLFLHSPRASQKIKPLLDFMLYPMWDAGLTVSQCVHTASSAIDFAKEDIEGCTSFLDARALIGHERLSAEFLTRFDKYRQQSIPAFIEAKLAERDSRLVRSGNSRYLVEPDVKEGKGGLRDVDTLHWLARYAYGPQATEKLISLGFFSEEDLAAFGKSLGFLWSVRFQLHMIKGRADEHLSFDVQRQVAARLGYKDRSSAKAVERLMKHYFLNAREIGRMTGIISTALEEAQVKRSRLFDGGFLGMGSKRIRAQQARKIRLDEFGLVDGFVLQGDRLNFKKTTKTIEKNPLELVRLFRIAGRKPACEIHPDALKKVAEAVPSLRSSQMKTPEIARALEKILLDTEDPEHVLRDMSETGLLGLCVPAFGMLVGRVVYGLYRRFTVDEHVLKSIGILTNIHKGNEASDHPISTQIMKRTTTPLAFYLAVLLHETAYALPQPDQDKVERKIKTSLSPFIIKQPLHDDVVWVASHHKIMAHMATRRNVMEARTVSQFAELVGTVERLNLLIVLTVCHLRVAGINSWDRWTRRNISVLYQATMAWFEGGELALARNLKQRRDGLRSKTARKLKDWPVPQLDRFFDRLSDGFFEAVNPEAAARFARLLDSVDQSDRQRASGHQSTGQGDVTLTLLDEGMVEAIIYSRDRPGLYANIAGVIATCGGDGAGIDCFSCTRAGERRGHGCQYLHFPRP